MFACPTTYDNWMKHASGIAKLVQARGPARFNNHFDKSMLASFRSMIVKRFRHMKDFTDSLSCRS